MNFGIECELYRGTADVLAHLGLDELHDYHCGCEDCDPHRTYRDWTAQEDCTADGEIISRILAYGTPEADDAIATLGSALMLGRATTSTDQGVHVHVGSEDMDTAAWTAFWRIWFRYQDDVGDLAAGRFGRVRNYNQPVHFREVVGESDGPVAHRFWNDDDTAFLGRQLGHPYGRASWVNPRTGHGTIEFRLWNATRTEWRLHLAVGVSTAIVAAAIDGVRVTKDDERSLIDIIGPYLSPQSYAAVVRHYISQENAA